MSASLTPVQSTLSYTGASGTDPLVIRTDGVPINIIQIDIEQMLVTNTPPLRSGHGEMGDGTAKTYTVPAAGMAAYLQRIWGAPR